MVLALKLLRKIPIVLHHSLDIYNFMRLVVEVERKILDMGREHCFVISLKSSNHVITVELVGLGSIDTVSIKPREVFQLPSEKRAAGIILIHNHPGGSLTPSPADIEMTGHVFHAGRYIGITLLDHVIITEHSYYSLKDSGWLERVENDLTYMDKYDIEEQCEKVWEGKFKELRKNHKVNINKSFKKGLQKGKLEGLQEGMEKSKLEIASNMLLNLNLDIETVQKATQLSIADLERILGE
jgi:DNA repair protein RadC